MNLLKLAWASLANRRYTAILTLATIAISVTLLLAVERVQQEARKSFASTISGTDLIVGGRTGAVQLLLYSVFRIGDATNNIRWESYQQIIRQPSVSWAVPISLGDSHRGWRVVGTTTGFFEHYRYGEKREVRFAEGAPFADLYDVVLGAEVAEALNYRLGQEVVVAHGTGRVSFVNHTDKPFRVVGILARTGTPVDRALYVSLEAIEAIHVDFVSGVQLPGRKISAEQARAMDLTPKQITAVYLGLKTPVAAFALQRTINQYRGEPLMAILPGATLQQLWSLVGVAENALTIVAAFVVVAGLLGMLSTMLSGLALRRREMAILRSVGARPHQVLALLVLESGVLTLLGIVAGVVLLYLGIAVSAPWVETRYGIALGLGPLSLSSLKLLAGVWIAGLTVGLWPGIKAYRDALADGLSLRI
jgi:putative ABC transport system permease protein